MSFYMNALRTFQYHQKYPRFMPTNAKLDSSDSNKQLKKKVDNYRAYRHRHLCLPVHPGSWAFHCILGVLKKIKDLANRSI